MKPTDPKVTAINPDKVVHVYSGKPGCMCGCLGKHTYRTVEQALERGYPPDGDQVSPDRIKRIVRNMLRTGDVRIDSNGILYAQTPNRLYAAYFS